MRRMRPPATTSTRAAAARTQPIPCEPTAVRAPNGSWANRRDRPPDPFLERRHRVTQVADRCRAVERPIVSEDLDGAAGDERRAAEHRHAQLFDRAERVRHGERNARRRSSPGDLAHEAEHAVLRRVVAAEDVAAGDGAALERRAMCGGALESGAIANVAVDQGSGKAAARCGAREDDELVSASGKRTHDCASQIAGAPGHEYFHEVELNS